MKTLYIGACALLLAGCATADVTRTCVETEVMVAHIRPFLASPEAVLAADAIIFGSVVCGSPQYAAARDRVLAAMGGQ